MAKWSRISFMTQRTCASLLNRRPSSRICSFIRPTLIGWHIVDQTRYETQLPDCAPLPGSRFIRAEQRCRMNSGLASAVSTLGIEEGIVIPDHLYRHFFWQD